MEKQLATEAKKRQAHGQTAPGRTLKQTFAEALGKSQRFRCPYCSSSYTQPPGHICPAMGQARDKAAEMVGANRHYVSDAKKIAHDAPEVLEQVKEGKLSIPQALKIAALPAEDRPAALARLHNKEPDEPMAVDRRHHL